MTEAIRAQDAEPSRTLMLELQAHDRDTRILQLVSQMAQTAPAGAGSSSGSGPSET